MLAKLLDWWHGQRRHDFTGYTVEQGGACTRSIQLPNGVYVDGPTTHNCVIRSSKPISVRVGDRITIKNGHGALLSGRVHQVDTPSEPLIKTRIHFTEDFTPPTSVEPEE